MKNQLIFLLAVGFQQPGTFQNWFQRGGKAEKKEAAVVHGGLKEVGALLINAKALANHKKNFRKFSDFELGLPLRA